MSNHKIVVGVFNPGQSPADNGRMIHALKLAKNLRDAGADVELVFEGQAVEWLPRLSNRTEDSHPFDTNYGHVFDDVRDLVKACNMCCIRFGVREAVQAAGFSIVGEGREHIDVARYVLEGYQVVNH